MDVTGRPAALRAGRREWTGLAVLTLPTILSAMDFGVLYLALPKIGATLHPSSTELLWIQDIYGFLIAGFLITMGNLGDRIGRRRLLMIGAAAFGALSIVCAYAPSAWLLILSRALLGVAGATLMPSTLALISNMFRDARQRSTAISIWATSLLFGAAIGPLVGGALLDRFWYGSVFLIGVPVMVLLLITAPYLLPEYRDPAGRKLDLPSVVLSLGAILPIVYAIKELASSGLTPPAALALMLGVLVGIGFVSRQRQLADPLLDLRLFSNREFGAALGILMFGAVAIGGVGLLFSQYLQLVHTFSPLTAGLLMIPDTVGLIGGSLLAPVAARRIRPAYVVGVGLLVSAVGFLVLTRVSPGSAVALTVIGVVIATFGVAPSWVLGTDLIVGSVRPEKAGSAAAVSETSSELGISLGVAVLGSVALAVYRGNLADHLPAGAAQGDGTLVGAVGAAGHLRGGSGRALLAAARSAFTSGFAVAAVVVVPILVILAVLSFVLLRKVNPTAEGEAPEPADAVRVPQLPQAPAIRGRDQRYVRQGSGRGLLARTGDLVLLCDVVRGQGSTVGALYEALADAADGGGGAELSRRVTGIVSAAGPEGCPSLCAFGPRHEGGLVALVHGDAALTIATAGHDVLLDGKDAVTVADRVITTPVESIRAVLGSGVDLRFAGDGLVPAEDEPVLSEPRAAPAITRDRTVPGITPVEPPQPVVLAAELSLPDPPAPDGEADLVVGVYCRRRHFNDPKMAYCTICGISMAQANRTADLGRRPSLGVLVLDDGTTVPLVMDLVFGRAPDSDAAVIAGAAGPVRITGDSVSRVHAWIVLDGWDVKVVDAGSRNGSFLCGPNETSWTRLTKGVPTLVLPGSTVAFGQRQLRYHSHRAQSVDFSDNPSLRNRE
ncbi:MAG TPA: MFS transporter [Pseudonocardiaceae bacterium]|nr:MFS transporter [Pseudonocardiaceae bacterium]